MPLAKTQPFSALSSRLLRQTRSSSPRVYQLQARAIATKQSRSANPFYRQQIPLHQSQIRPLHRSAVRRRLIPDAQNPAPKESEKFEHATAPAEITIEEYHQLSDIYLDELVTRLEELQEARNDLDVEYANNVLSIEIVNKGTYIINKQPPNKQIWLSSPLTGPKRYDWVILGASINHKEEGDVGDWIYLRDGSSLTDLLKKEIGVDLSIDD